MKRSPYWLVTLFTLVMSASGCAQQGKVPTKDYPVRLESGFTLPALLAEEASVESQAALGKLLQASWYSAFEVAGARNREVSSLDTCEQYLSNKSPALRPVRESDRNAFLEVVLMCEAARLIADANPSTRSNLPTPVPIQHLPAHLPKTVALVTSSSEWERLQSDPSVRIWADVNPFTRNVLKNGVATFYFEGGSQQVSVVGRGDMDHDGNEDALLLVQDALDQGSYFNLRLFLMTVDEHGTWQVLPKI